MSSSDPASFDFQRPTAEVLRWAYRHAAFPMADVRRGVIEWYSPEPRGIFPLDGFRVPDSLARRVRRAPFRIVADTAFEDVMRACAVPREPGDETWIDERLVAAYLDLHAAGEAHCVEAWLAGRLVGGLYGVHLGGAFFGESMFVRPAEGGTDASKICLVHLVAHLRRRGFRLLDTQFWNPHLDQFGCIEIPRDEYVVRLAEALAHPVAWGHLVGDPPPA